MRDFKEPFILKDSNNEWESWGWRGCNLSMNGSVSFFERNDRDDDDEKVERRRFAKVTVSKLSDCLDSQTFV